MYTRRILLLLIFLGIIVHVVENKSEISPDYPLEVQMMKLESELQPDSAKSTYVRVIVWNTMPSRENLQYHFDKFDLLQLDEERLMKGKFDVIQKSESTYERFLYADYPEQQLIVTVFIKVNFNIKRNSFSLKYFIEKINRVLKKYDLIDKDESVPDQIDPNGSIISIETTVSILIISSLFIWFKLIHPKKKEENSQNNQENIVSSSNESIPASTIDEKEKNSQKQHAILDDTPSNTVS